MPDRSASGDGAGALNRRALLAAVGVSALSGCSTLGSLTGDDTQTIHSYDLRQIDPDEEFQSPVPESIPVEIDLASLRESRKRAVTLLSTLPIPLGADDIPNGHVREHLADEAATATARLDDARTARTPFLALERLGNARESARFAATGWAVADDGLDESTILDEHRSTVLEAREARGAYEYLGDDLVRAVAVHSRIESSLARAATSEIRSDGDSENKLLKIAEWGETTEEARRTLEDAQHLSAQFEQSLPEDAGSVEERITRAAETLFEMVQSNGSDLGSEPTTDERGVPEQLIEELRGQMRRRPERVARATGPASAVTDAVDWLTRYRAFDWATQRIEAGEIGTAESAEQIKSLRERAYDAISKARQESPAPPLARRVLHDAGWRVVAADRKIAEHRGEIPVRRLHDEISDYFVAIALARSVPETCRTVVTALESA